MVIILDYAPTFLSEFFKELLKGSILLSSCHGMTQKRLVDTSSRKCTPDWQVITRSTILVNGNAGYHG
jgi:hypothetical protein